MSNSLTVAYIRAVAFSTPGPRSGENAPVTGSTQDLLKTKDLIGSLNPKTTGIQPVFNPESVNRNPEIYVRETPL